MQGSKNSHCCKVGIYVRESRDDNGENYETIETQRDLLVDHIKKQNLGELVRIYIDDNVSGSGFERKGITQLKEDIMSGNIELLVIKDLSRLGRNNAKTLLFLDFLEEYGARVITADGRYDSLKDNETVGIETWFNERYVRDISKKIRTNLRFKIEKGEYLGHAPYGYIKSTIEKNRLCINNCTVPIVKDIYKLYREGYGYEYIARLLNSKRILPPSGGALNLWNAVAVQRILCNRVYIGDTVQGVSEKISFKSKKTRRLPQSRWVITENTHEAIIAREEFEAIQEIRSSRKSGKEQCGSTPHLLRGILACGGCASAMFARVRKNRPTGYICANYGRNGKGLCTSHHVSESFVCGILMDELMALFEDSEICHKGAMLLERELCKSNNSLGELAKLERQLQVKQRQQETLYLDRLEDRISEQLFTRMNTGLENGIFQMQQEIERLKAQKVEILDAAEIMEQALKGLKGNGLTREIVNLMVERITVYDAGDDMSGLDLPGRQGEPQGCGRVLVVEFRCGR